MICPNLSSAPCIEVEDGKLLRFEQEKMRDKRKQCCGSGMFIPDPDFYPFRIPDPKTATKERGEKKFVVKPFFVATNQKVSV